MELDVALEHALEGDAVLFAGAGCSVGATNIRDRSLPTGRDLARHLAALCGLPEDSGLEDCGEEFINVRGEDELIRELQEQYTVKRIAPAHALIARVPWRRIWTTNYDDVLERACTAASRRLAAVTLGQRIRDVPKDCTLCVHLNGYVGRLDRTTLGSELKLTETSYITNTVAGSPWAVLFREDLNTSRAVFFVGYSLYDLDIKRLLYPTTDLQDKCFFVLGQNPDATTRRRAERFGQLVTLDCSDFAGVLEEKTRTYTRRVPVEPPGHCLRKEKVPVDRPAFSDQLVFDLLLLGRTEDTAIWSSLQGESTYFLQRSQVDRILDRIRAGEPVIVHSELANGKTLLLEGIKCRALQEGYLVYTLIESADDLRRELELIPRDGKRTLIVVDDYPGHMDGLRMIGESAPRNAAVLMSARTAANDVYVDQVCELLNRDSIFEFALDRLSDSDLDWVSRYFEEYGLWADKASWSRDSKVEFLRDVCHREFHAVLICLFESPQIMERFQRILTDLTKDRPHYGVLASILALAVLHYRTSIDTLVDLWGASVLETQFQRNPVMTQLVDFAHGVVRLRSSAAAAFILKRVADINCTVDALIHTTRMADRASETSDSYAGLRTRLMRFSELQHLLPERDKESALIRYYEGTKNLYGCRQNPYFWLQYAIACLVMDKLERAKAYFDTAYSLAASRIGFNTYQIDNHYARYLLAEAAKSRNPKRCMNSFREARGMVFRQMNEKERYHYPYRVATMFRDFWETFKSDLSPEDQEEVFRAAQFIANRIPKLDARLREHRHVIECRAAMESILADRTSTSAARST